MEVPLRDALTTGRPLTLSYYFLMAGDPPQFTNLLLKDFLLNDATTSCD